MNTWHLAQSTYQSFRGDSLPRVAVLPFGATEPHNLHLPYGTDTFQVDVIADKACQIASERGAPVLRLPTIPYGTETNQMRFPFAMNLQPTTLLAIVTDLLASLSAHGVPHCVLLNGHGGNDFKWMLRQLHGIQPVHLFLCDWFRVAADQYPRIFKSAGDHGGEMETSMILAHHPELVHMDQADPGSTAASRFEAVNRGWVSLTRPWHLLTTNSGAGDPRPATAEKGHELTHIVVERIGSFLVELALSPVDAAFPFAAPPPS